MFAHSMKLVIRMQELYDGTVKNIWWKMTQKSSVHDKFPRSRNYRGTHINLIGVRECGNAQRQLSFLSQNKSDACRESWSRSIILATALMGRYPTCPETLSKSVLSISSSHSMCMAKNISSKEGKVGRKQVYTGAHTVRVLHGWTFSCTCVTHLVKTLMKLLSMNP